MLRHWDGLQWAPETRGGFPAIKALEDALSIAQPYTEWPFGEYERAQSQKTPKAWHTPAHSIALIIIQVLGAAGQTNPAISRNSIVVKIVRKALIRMQVPNFHMITTTAIAAYLTRWDRQYGLTPQGIARFDHKVAGADLLPSHPENNGAFLQAATRLEGLANDEATPPRLGAIIPGDSAPAAYRDAAPAKPQAK
jgi:hypothetical protein